MREREREREREGGEGGGAAEEREILDYPICWFVTVWHDRSTGNGLLSLSYFSFHDWCTKGHGICYPVCGMVHIKELLLLIGKSNSCGSSGFPLSLSEWSFTIRLTPYNRK